MSAYTARGFTPGQQGLYRPLVEAAWKAHAARNGLLVTDDLFSPSPKSKSSPARSWYEEELEIATGKTSTSQCDRKRDFTKAMAHFEAIVGDSIYWNTRLYGDDARRLLFNIREVCQGNDVEENYMRAMAKRSLQLFEDDPLPDLETLSYQHLLIIMGELKRWLRRKRLGRPVGRPKREALQA